MSQRPNFLIIMVDQWQANNLSCRGDCLAQTPHLDKLASEGVRFRHAFTPYPLCTPARSSIYTGLHAHTHGAVVNGLSLNEGIPLWVERMSEVGYRQSHVGKWHIGRAGLDSRAWGFDHVVDHRADYYRFLQDQGVSWTKEESKKALMNDADQPHQGRFPYDLELFRSHFLVDRTIEFIEATAKQRVPFVAVCSFFGPHAPYQIPEPYYSLYSPADVELPISFYENASDKPEALRRWDPGKWSRDWPEEKWRSIMAVYFGYLTLIDAEIGRLLDVLDDLELSKETFVLFVADHGEMNSAHRYLYKGPYFFEEVLRIPFIVRYPPLLAPGIVNDDMVSSLDIMPTVLELAALDRAVTGHGRSLISLLVGESKVGWDHIYSEMFDFDAGAHFLWCPMRCYRDRRWKFVERLPLGADGEELYDLANDPHELHNLVAKPGYQAVRDQLWAALRDEAAAVNDPWPNIPATAPDWYRLLRGLPDWYEQRRSPSGRNPS